MKRIERIEQIASFSIGRACLFTALGGWALVFGLITWPIMAMKSAAIVSAFAMAVLALKGLQAGRRSYRKSETWILLGKTHDLPEEVAEKLIPEILQRVFWRYATYAAGASTLFWLAALGFWLGGAKG